MDRHPDSTAEHIRSRNLVRDEFGWSAALVAVHGLGFFQLGWIACVYDRDPAIEVACRSCKWSGTANQPATAVWMLAEHCGIPQTLAIELAISWENKESL